MNLTFKKYEAKNNWEILGTVKEMAGKGGKIAFIKTNFKNTDKQVAVVIEKKNGESTVVSCHKDLSSKLRAGEINIRQLAGLNVIAAEGRDGGDPVFLIVLPGTGGTQS